MIKNSKAKIIHKKKWNDYFLFSLHSPVIASQAQPGQFIMIRITSSPHPLLRRPFSIHSKKGETVDIFFQVQGGGTFLLSQKNLLHHLDIIGPLGKGFKLDSSFQDKNIAVIGGGRGIAPLFFLAQNLRLRGSSVIILYGGKTLQDLPLKQKFEQHGFDLNCSTEDGSYGFKGLVSELLEKELKSFRPEAIFACGPEEMMKTISQIAQHHYIPAQFSLESIMGCGIGACWGCVKKIRRENKESWLKICEEGPVFNSEEIVWE